MKLLRNEKGIALVMVMIIAFIGLAMVSTLLFMLTQGTRISGFQKTFRTTDEAGLGGVQIAAQFIKDNVWNAASGALLQSAVVNFNSPDQCLIDKLTTTRGEWATSDPAKYFWPNCAGDRATAIDANLSPDFTFCTNSVNCITPTDPAVPIFRVDTKIIDTVKGNTAANGIGGQLGGEGVVSGGGTQISPPPNPTLYRIEVQAQDAVNPQQKSKYSVLYAY